jgi:hypothetical protein
MASRAGIAARGQRLKPIAGCVSCGADEQLHSDSDYCQTAEQPD